MFETRDGVAMIDEASFVGVEGVSCLGRGRGRGRLALACAVLSVNHNSWQKVQYCNCAVSSVSSLET
jgi:hypothetical protein